MPQHWLKPLGVTEPHDPMPNEWTLGADLAQYEFATGPAGSHPPQIGWGDLVLFHGVIFSRVFAAAEVLDGPRKQKDPVYGWRWPWVYVCRVDLWVPEIEDGLASSEVAPKRAIGRIQVGGDFALLSPAEYTAIRDALAALPSAVTRT